MATKLEDRALEQDFSERFGELVAYCQQRDIVFTRNFAPKNLEMVKQCKAYSEIVKLGKRALPLIRGAIDLSGHGACASAQIGGLIPAISEIVGKKEFRIPEEMQIPKGDSTGFVWKLSSYTDRVCNYTYNWLSKYLFGFE